MRVVARIELPSTSARRIMARFSSLSLFIGSSFFYLKYMLDRSSMQGVFMHTARL